MLVNFASFHLLTRYISILIRPQHKSESQKTYTVFFKPRFLKLRNTLDNFQRSCHVSRGERQTQSRADMLRNISTTTTPSMTNTRNTQIPDNFCNDFPVKSKIKVLYTNDDNSLFGKINELKTICHQQSPDIICLREINPKHGTLYRELCNIDGYTSIFSRLKKKL